METQLSKLASCTIAVMYRDFLTRREYGASYNDARTFEDGYKPDESKFKHPNDFSDGCKILKKKGLITENIWGDRTLTDDAIAMMENQFSEGLKSVKNYLSAASDIAGIASLVLSMSL